MKKERAPPAEIPLKVHTHTHHKEGYIRYEQARGASTAGFLIDGKLAGHSRPPNASGR